ncbi:MAG: hypothetical protein STSR0003_03150 [Smithella sp.]
MYDKLLLKEKLEQIMDAVERINRRFVGITTPNDFLATDINHDKLDAIAMLLIAVGESFKKIDKETEGSFLKKYPDIDWKGVIGVRNNVTYGYRFGVDLSVLGHKLDRNKNGGLFIR